MSRDKIDPQAEDELRRKRALADLAALEDGAEGMPGTGMGNAYRAATKRLQAMGHDVGENGGDDDPAERWGRLIGRGLGFAVLAYLIWHLISTYVLK
ncbi:MAG: hypothetical protein C0605_14575 [Hyphomicrobiales bacterium]|nr:MAG: hypothetical protein C0605_14575 [Hyphomicrobiales bacterium]